MRTKVMLLPRSARFLRAVVVTLLVVGGLTAWSATPAVAVDNGDGTWTCVSGEICFKKHDDTYWNRDIKHFYWSQQHGGYNWCACDGGSGGPVAFNASMIYNRDTECAVFILDGLGSYQTWNRGMSWYTYVGWLWNDANWAHTRCSVNQDWGT